MSNRPILILVLIFLVSACGGTKNIKGSNTANSALSAKNIIATHEAASPDFTTMAARVQVAYEDSDRSQSITVSLRMEKDKTIWVKASVLGITLAKVLITPERVSYYETLGNSYFEGDFALLSDWLGTDIDFEKAQSIMLGQSIFRLNASTYTSSVQNNTYKLFPKQQPVNFIHSVFLNPENFKVASETLSQPNEQRLLSVRYGNYQTVENNFFPSEVVINTTEGDEKTKIDIVYKDIDLNVPISFPFTIPDGYDEIQLN